MSFREGSVLLSLYLGSKANFNSLALFSYKSHEVFEF